MEKTEFEERWEEGKKWWLGYKDILDPIGQEFVDIFLEIADTYLTLGNVNHTLQKFIFERGMLYGALIKMMLDNDLTKWDMSEEDIRNAGQYMLVFIPKKEGDFVTLFLHKKGEEDAVNEIKLREEKNT